MARYALVKNNKVKNVIDWDGISPLEVDGELHLHEQAGPGDNWPWDSPADPIIDPKDIIKFKISELEILETARRIAEAILGTDEGWLANNRAKIAALRQQLEE